MLKTLADRAKSWVMVSPQSADPFVKLPNERVLYVSPPRTSLDLSSPSTYTQPWSVKSYSGVAYITNQRVRPPSQPNKIFPAPFETPTQSNPPQIVYLPTTPTSTLHSFSAPILHLSDSYVRAPFFGANYWAATLRPVAGGGIPAPHPLLDLRLTFREGGAFDYHSVFEQLKERVAQAAQLARDAGAEVDLRNVHLEQLPAYEAAREVGGEVSATPPEPEPPLKENGNGNESFVQPDEPPPGYEEAQAQAVGMSLESRLRDDVERGRRGEDDD